MTGSPELLSAPRRCPAGWMPAWIPSLRRRARLRRLAELLGLDPGARLLEVGARPGGALHPLADPPAGPAPVDAVVGLCTATADASEDALAGLWLLLPPGGHAAFVLPYDAAQACPGEEAAVRAAQLAHRLAAADFTGIRVVEEPGEPLAGVVVLATRPLLGGLFFPTFFGLW